LLDNKRKIRYSDSVINKNDKQLESLIVELLEDFNKHATNISSEVSRRMIAKAIVKKFKKMYDYSLKYYYS